jgi:predicted protein tyrosine phosphatase
MTAPAIAPWKITVCGIDELPEHSERGVTHVLSILDPDRAIPDAFGSFGEHERLELRFLDEIEDTEGGTPPMQAHVEQVLAFGRTLIAEPQEDAHLLVHCHAGVSRSTASMILIIAQARPDLPADVIVQEVFRVRAKAWPNLRMIEMGDALLGRGGTIVAAVKDIYRAQLVIRPHLADFFIGENRAREVDAARSQQG